MKIVIDWDSVILNTSTSLINNWNLLNPNKQLKTISSNFVEWDFSNVLKGTDISLKEATLVSEGDSFYIEVPYTVSLQDYGKTPEGYRTSGEATATCSKTDSDPVDVAFVGLPDSRIARVWFEKELSAGNYTIHLEYKYVCEEDKDIENPEKLTASDPITYIVTFTVKDTENK